MTLTQIEIWLRNKALKQDIVHGAKYSYQLGVLQAVLILVLTSKDHHKRIKHEIENS